MKNEERAIEEFSSAQAGLNRNDHKTVALRINGRMFVFTSVESFRNFAVVMLHNADQFDDEAQRQKEKKPTLRVVN